jgi:hypothetical protein
MGTTAVTAAAHPRGALTGAGHPHVTPVGLAG